MDTLKLLPPKTNSVLTLGTDLLLAGLFQFGLFSSADTAPAADASDVLPEPLRSRITALYANTKAPAPLFSILSPTNLSVVQSSRVNICGGCARPLKLIIASSYVLAVSPSNVFELRNVPLYPGTN